MKNYVFFILLLSFQVISAQNKVLVYYETNGFRHSSIDDGIEMITDLGNANGLWSTDSSDNSNVFTEENLSQYNVVIWCNTSGNDLLTNNQQNAFENYIANGGGYLGIHAATDTYRDKSWPFYNDLVGAIVQSNPNHTSSNHENTMDIVDAHADHQSVAFLDDTWNKTEEYYYWKNNGGQLFEGNNNLLMVRETGNNDFDEVRPMSWFKEFMGGRSFYTALGHNDGDYRNDQNFITHVEEGIKWAGKFNDSVDFEQVIDDGEYVIQDVDLNVALETDSSDNNVYTNAVNKEDSQIWIFEHQSNNIFKVQNKSTEWFVETPQAVCEENANVAAWRDPIEEHHTFKVILSGSNYILEPGHCEGKALSAERSLNEENAFLKNVNTNDNEQLWKLVIPNDVVLSNADFDFSSEENIKAYPNPVEDKLIVNGLHVKEDLEVRIYDIQGNQIGAVQKINDEINSIDFSKFSPGVYFIKYSNNSIPTQRVIKM